jgi:hypothetical protein
MLGKSLRSHRWRITLDAGVRLQVQTVALDMSDVALGDRLRLTVRA